MRFCFSFVSRAQSGTDHFLPFVGITSFRRALDGAPVVGTVVPLGSLAGAVGSSGLCRFRRLRQSPFDAELDFHPYLQSLKRTLSELRLRAERFGGQAFRSSESR